MAQQQIILTQEQLQQLIEAVRIGAVGDIDGITKKTQKGSFSSCPARFNGCRSHDVVEEFITNIETFKDVETISDEDALKGISLLFQGLAATWWLGVRKEAKTWSEALALIREHFAPIKPAYQIYGEIFETKQDEHTPIDEFVCLKRALLAQLPEGRHDEETELDLIYSLLNIKYRKHIQRHEVASFRVLLEKGRIIEHNNMEDEATQVAVRASKARRCTYCNFRGHTYETCRKRKQAEAQAAEAAAED